MELKKIIGAAGCIMMTLTFSAAAQEQPPKSIVEVAKENREAQARKTVEETVNQWCSKADDPKIQQTYPKIQEKCKDKSALIDSSLKQSDIQAYINTGVLPDKPIKSQKAEPDKLPLDTQWHYSDGTPVSEKTSRALDAQENAISAQAAAQARARAVDTQSPQGAASPSESAQNDVEGLQDMLDSLADKTPRELGEQFARDIQFPGRDAWEQRLGAARDKLVSTTQVVIDLIRSNAPSGTLNSALFDMKVAQTQYSDVQAEGMSQAADWERKH